jgi:hypothetical protein
MFQQMDIRFMNMLPLSLTSMVNKTRFPGFYIANFLWVCQVDVELHLFKDAHPQS